MNTGMSTSTSTGGLQHLTHAVGELHVMELVLMGCTCSAQKAAIVKTYYCLWQAVGNDLMFEVEVIDPKDNQRDVAKED